MGSGSDPVAVRETSEVWQASLGCVAPSSCSCVMSGRDSGQDWRRLQGIEVFVLAGGIEETRSQVSLSVA